MAFRVPTTDVSAVDLTVKVAKLLKIMVCVEKCFQTTMKGILGFTEDLVVSQDFVGDSRTSIIDANGGIGFYFLQNYFMV
jgi:glyceraldehyde 3-phosphate dehydrogenase